MGLTPMPNTWSYGITTVPSRIETHLTSTLESLSLAGFDKPHLFVDHENPAPYAKFNLPITTRSSNLCVAGNWVLSAWELYIRNPDASYYALFQDDLQICKDVKAYVERQPYPHKAYLNLYTFPENAILCGSKNGWHPSNQMGRGAVALIFSREALSVLLTQPHLFSRFQRPSDRRYRSIDGGIVTSMNNAGWREYIHHPSLVQHTGLVTTVLDNRRHPLSPTFPGVDFSALSLIPTTEEQNNGQGKAAEKVEVL